MAAPKRITFVQKTQLTGYDPTKLNAGEVNEIKTVVNEHADRLAAGLTTNQIRGGLYRIPHTDALGTIPASILIKGMEALAVNGLGAAETAAGVKAEGVYFKLLANTQGTVMALIDEQFETTAREKCLWVRVSGEEEDRVISYPELPLEDAGLLKQGEVYRYTYPDGPTRLFQLKVDINQFMTPLPTEDESDDDYYIHFAPLGNEIAYTNAQAVQAVADSGKFATAAALLAASPAAYTLPRILFVQQAGPDRVGVKGNPARPYPDINSAVAAANPGDIICIVGIAYGGRITKNLRVTGLGGIIADYSLAIGGEGSQGLTVDISNLTFRGGAESYQDGITVYESAASKHSIRIRRCEFLDATGVNWSPGAGQKLDVIRLENCTAHNTAATHAGLSATPGKGIIRFSSRADGLGGTARYEVADCAFESANNPIVSGFMQAGSQVVLQGFTTLRPGAGQPLTKVYNVPGETVYAQVDVITDERPSGTGGTSYTDEQAQDAVAALFSGAHTGITFAYDDTAGRITATVTVSGGAGVDPNGIVTKKVSTTATELTMEQTGDAYGGTRLRLLSRNGAAGGLFEAIAGTQNPGGLDLMDLAFMGVSGSQKNFRFENRLRSAGGVIREANTKGEFQFIDDAETSTPGISHAFGNAFTVFNTDFELGPGRACFQYSPNGSKWRISVTDAGALITSPM